MNLRTRIGKRVVEGVIGNSPGPRKSIEECHQVGKSPAAAITFGSITLEERSGNQGSVYWAEGAPLIALNSLGLPNKPMTSYFKGLVDDLVLGYKKPVIASFAGFTAEEFRELASWIPYTGLTLEFNMTCPNVEKKGIFAYDLEEVDRTLGLVRKVAPEDNLVVKLNYHPDSRYIEAVCKLLIKHEIDSVALCNTLPNCLVLGDDLTPVITPNRGLAGMSGSSIKPAVMGQVLQYRAILPPEIDIICEGGIWTGKDILDYFAAGGSFCRIGTMYAERGVKAFTELTFQFIEEMEKRGYESLADIPRLEDLPPISLCNEKHWDHGQ